GLPRRDQCPPDQPWRRSVCDPAWRADRADGDRAGRAGGTGSGGVAFNNRSRQWRFRLDGALNHFNFEQFDSAFPAFFTAIFAFTIWTLTGRLRKGILSTRFVRSATSKSGVRFCVRARSFLLSAYNLNAKPLTPWRIMRWGSAGSAVVRFWGK